jgi:hypothetical protein
VIEGEREVQERGERREEREREREKEKEIIIIKN